MSRARVRNNAKVNPRVEIRRHRGQEVDRKPKIHGVHRPVARSSYFEPVVGDRLHLCGRQMRNLFSRWNAFFEVTKRKWFLDVCNG